MISPTSPSCPIGSTGKTAHQLPWSKSRTHGMYKTSQNSRNWKRRSRGKDSPIELRKQSLGANTRYRLKQEKKSWDNLLETSSKISGSSKSIKSERPKRPMPPVPPRVTDINADLLDDPEQAAILASLVSFRSTTPTAAPPVPPKSPASKARYPASQTRPQSDPSGPGPDSIQSALHDPLALAERLRALTQSLEPTIDAFAQGVHTLSQYRLTAERTADHVLGSAAAELEKRDREAKEEAGTAGMGVDGVLGALGGLLGGRR
jgi:kinetochore protein Mis13/DSN1